jgi:hypothetical protein
MANAAVYTNLDNEIFAAKALEGFVKELAPFSAFSTNFSAAPGVRGAQILVPLVASLTATTFAQNYALTTGNATKTVVTVTLNCHKHVPIGQFDLEAANSSAASLESFAFQQGRALAVAVLQDVFTLVTTANFKNNVTKFSAAAMDVPQLRAARLLLNQGNAPIQPRACLLDCVPMDSLLAVTNFVQAQMFKDTGVLQEGKIMRALGMDFYELNNLWVTCVIGFAAHASAIAIAMRYLAPQPGHTYSDARAVTDPGTGATFGIRDHYDNNTGTRYLNLECNYGYSVGITAGGVVYVNTAA